MDTIATLRAKQGKVEVEGDVVALGPIREFAKFGKSGRVANATLQDSSGKIVLTLWNDEIDKVKVGARIRVLNGYVSEWQGEKQLTAGRFGSLEVVAA